MVFSVSKVGVMMSQNDQMRQTVDRLLGEIVCLEGAVLYEDPWPELELRVRDMKKIAQQALAAEPPLRLTRERIQPLIERLGRIGDEGWQFTELALMELISLIEDELRKDFGA